MLPQAKSDAQSVFRKGAKVRSNVENNPNDPDNEKVDAHIEQTHLRGAINGDGIERD